MTDPTKPARPSPKSTADGPAGRSSVPVKPPGALGSGMALLRLFGIEVRLHVSVLIIFLLIVFGLGRGLLPQWHPEWADLLLWSAALSAGVLFLVSLLAHEFAHALVARRAGLETSSITLFLFGGLAAIEQEPQRPQDELQIAAAGPLMSLLLSLLFSGLVTLLAGHELRAAATTPAELLGQLSWTATIALWLSSVNLMLALFNLVPGFPMDGGRVFRALLWWYSGDIVWATRKAVLGGRLFGWTLMATGAWMLIGGGGVDGLWLILIGWFIDHLAQASVAQLLLDRALQHTRVATIMRTRFERVPAETSVQTFVADYVLRSRQVSWPVTEQDRDLGVVTMDDLPDSLQSQTATVANFMKPLNAAPVLCPETDAKTALRLTSQSRAPLPVMRQGRVVGLLDHLDILRWYRSVAEPRGEAAG